MSTTQQVRQFIAENFLFGPPEQIKEDESFLESGILDSTGVLQLIEFLERTYGISIADEEVVPENLDTLERISEYLNRKLDAPSDEPASELDAADCGGRR
jgi:acyl carrier protein